MSSVGGGLAAVVAVAAVAVVVAAVGKAARRYHRGEEEIKTCYMYYPSSRGETERMHWDHKEGEGKWGPVWQ
jgi:hypothetical protein